MLNNYEAPEIIEVGDAEEVILGTQKSTGRFDSLTQVYNRDPDPILSDE